MPTGYITYYNSLLKFGFVDCPELNYYDIYFYKADLNKSYKNIYASDFVEFELNIMSNENQPTASDIKFVRNRTLEYLHEDFSNKKLKRGFLKKIGDNYYVKDYETHLYIKLRISKYEIDLFKCYETKLNTEINYQIIVFSNKNKIRAINIDRLFCEEYMSATSGNICFAKVQKKIKMGYEILVEGKILGFIPNSISLVQGLDLIENTEIKVRCIKKNKETSDSPVFEIL